MSLTSATCCVTLGKSLLLSGLEVALLQNARLGPSDLPLMLLPSPDSPRLPVWVRTWPLSLPKACLPPTPSIPEGTPFPFPAQAGAWQALGCREDRRWGNYPSSSSLRGEGWPVASHNRPRDTEGHLSGGPKVSFQPSLLLWPTASLFSPPSQEAVPARALF